jgi:signal transduction histidine kinase
MHDFQSDISAIQSIDAVPRILEVICRTTGMDFSAVARVTDDRWVCCAVHDEIKFGLVPGGELKVETTICDEIRQDGEAIVIDHVAEDKTYRGHPTPAMYGFQSYISMPIILADGQFFGTLCAIDPRPARLKTPETIGMFKLFAELIATHLGAIERLAQSEASLMDERKTSELRDQFIAVLGHDLRNPLASIDAGINLVQKAKSPKQTTEIFNMMQNSVMRMSKLIDNVLDFARGRLGGGLTLERSIQPLEPALTQALAELQSSFPERQIEVELRLPEPVNCDPARIARLFSNLLGNALTHGSVTAPIKVKARTDGGVFELSVVNSGDPIPEAALPNLFKPFYRAASRPNQQGLGLGLYIASEIARAHGGTLDVASSGQETRFTFQMPAA